MIRNQSVLVAGLSLLLSSAAVAQDLETRAAHTASDDDSDVTTRFLFESEALDYDNLDFRVLDESSDQAIMDSDDRFGFAYTGVGAEVGYKFEESSRFLFGVNHRGLWGNDQIGAITPGGNFLYVTALSLTHELYPGATLEVGRGYYSIGGLGGAKDYTLSDILDMVSLTQELGTKGSIRLMADIPSLSTADDNAAFLEYAGVSSESPYAMRGDRATTRSGLVLNLDGLSERMESRVYAFYSDIGAEGTGSDISYEGTQGNFADNDWVANYGARTTVTKGNFSMHWAVDGSIGVDRKELVANDVDTNGFALTAGGHYGSEANPLQANLGYYNAQGATYSEDGLMWSHGYVSMKGSHTGGLITNRLLGWHTSSYVGSQGISHEPHDKGRKAGTQVLSANIDYTSQSKHSLGLSWWGLSDTGTTWLNVNNVDLIEPPFGYSREEYAAQERMGRWLGQEIDLDLSLALSDTISLNTTAAALLPGDFYAIETERVAGDQLGGTETAWAVASGIRAEF